MSLAVRNALAAAASTVDGIECEPYFIGSTQPGHAMVRLERIEYPNPFGGICHWNVVVMLPQDQAQAEQYIDTVGPLLREAVGAELVITRIQPQQLNIPKIGVQPVLFINGHREQE